MKMSSNKNYKKTLTQSKSEHGVQQKKRGRNLTMTDAAASYLPPLCQKKIPYKKTTN